MAREVRPDLQSRVAADLEGVSGCSPQRPETWKLSKRPAVHRPRSATSVGLYLNPTSARSCCASMRTRGSRQLQVAPRRSCGCSPERLQIAQHRTTASGPGPREPRRRAGPVRRQGHRRRLPAPARDRPQRRARQTIVRERPGASSTCTSSLTTAPRTRRRQSATGSPRTRAFVMHFTPTSSVVAEPRRALVRRTNDQDRCAAARTAPSRQRNSDMRALDRHLERQPSLVRQDRDRRP